MSCGEKRACGGAGEHRTDLALEAFGLGFAHVCAEDCQNQGSEGEPALQLRGGVLSWLHVAPKSCRSRRAAGEQRLVYLWLWSFILLREVFRPTEGIPGTFGFLTHTSGEKHALGYKATFVAPHKVHSGSGRASVTAAAPQPLLRTQLPNTRGISA